MEDLFRTPVFYISFKTDKILENQFRDIGFTNINHYNAVRGENFNVEDLINNNVITARTYNELVTGVRHEHSGTPSIGSIGCYVSHVNLWKKCVDDNLPYMVIAEDDVVLNKLNPDEIKIIQDTFNTPNSIFISPIPGTITYLNDIPFSFFGLHFYIVSNQACRNMLRNVYPIDMQVDAYMSNLMYRGIINLTFYNIFGQKIHPSSIQNICLKCEITDTEILYTGKIFFIMIIMIIVIIVIIVIRMTY
jgi:hypothetical protein